MEKELFLNVLNDIAPLSLQEEWDNSGVQIAFGDREISRVLVALEVTKDVIREAKREHCDFILCHHPLLFHPVKCIEPEFTVGAYILELIRAEIGVYAAHTCFDKAPGGNNDYLMKALGCAFPEELAGGIARIGRLDRPVSFDEFISDVNAGGFLHLRRYRAPRCPGGERSGHLPHRCRALRHGMAVRSEYGGTAERR